MKKLIFLALVLISFTTINSQDQCDKMLNDFKEKLSTERPQNLDDAMSTMQTFTTKWSVSGCNRTDANFVAMFNNYTEFTNFLREDGNSSNDFVFSFAKNSTSKQETSTSNDDQESNTEESGGFGNKLMEKYAEGGVGFMTCVLICLILGLALCIERIIYLHLASSNSKDLLSKIETALKNKSVASKRRV